MCRPRDTIMIVASSGRISEGQVPSRTPSVRSSKSPAVTCKQEYCTHQEFLRHN